VIKSDARLTAIRGEIRAPRTAAAPEFGSEPMAAGGVHPPARDELLRLMTQLRDELTAFLSDADTGREFSRNRD
jgi:hypothetical protein